MDKTAKYRIDEDTLGCLFNEVIIAPCCIPSRFYLDDKGLFTITFEGYCYQSPNYEQLVEFIKDKAANLTEFDVIPF